ncbi:hypothetical protein [Frateuria terrea]|uniref:DUF4440 domain-containing protein n=1 Tax=Frateuria terrea TaxID=529704 RepID=A0A1H6QGN7_9GAMM|nr:hypothetical protein [Frateuria terrea]SEI38600.1 hypothetical protein SAMN04487997_0363 [Frateuria terrea]SFP04097.1 hypothetical protein SAMN02927913_0278 [Frateuria terrea]
MQAQKWRLFPGLVVLFAALAGCRHTSDETRVREAIASAEQAAEQSDAGGVVEPLSEDFDGNGGQFGRKDLANLVRLARLRGEHVGVTLGPISAERRGERLVASFTASLTQGSRLLPDAAGVYQVETAWRREGDEWRCYSATWKRQL